MFLSFGLIILIAIGFLVSIILFIIGIARGLMKKGWRLIWYSIAIFIIVNIVSFLARIYYVSSVQPSAIRNLPNYTIAAPQVQVSPTP